MLMVTAPPAADKLGVAAAGPLTVNVLTGEVVPIPTLPAPVIRIASELFAPKSIGVLEDVPKNPMDELMYCSIWPVLLVSAIEGVPAA